MSDKTTWAASSQQPGQAETSGQPGAGTDPSQQPVTMAVLQSVLKEELRKMTQSTSDRVEARISRRIKELEKSLASLGLPPEQVLQAKQNIVMDELTSVNPQAETSLQQAAQSEAGGAPPAATTPIPAWLQVIADDIEEELGYRLEPGKDLEAAQVIAADPATFERTLRKATKKAQARIAEAGNPATSSPQARIPTMIAGSTPGSEALATQYVNDVMQARGQPDKIRQLKEDYRKKGVDVDHVVFTRSRTTTP